MAEVGPGRRGSGFATGQDNRSQQEQKCMEPLRACQKITRGPVLMAQTGGTGHSKAEILDGPTATECRRLVMWGQNTLWAADLLVVAGVGSVGTARNGDASP